MQQQDSLPSTNKVTAGDKNDPSRLPSYRETRRYRYHPYSRPIPVLVDEADRLLVRFPSFCFSLVFTDCTVIQNTIYDDECVVLNVPPLPARVVSVESIHFFGDLVFKQSLIAPPSATIWRFWRTSPSKYGTHPCIWITRPTSFYSHRGPSSSFFFLPYFPDLVIRSLLLALHAPPVDKTRF